MDPAPHLRDFQALVDRAGGRARLLLVAEALDGARALLETFARDLFAEPEPEASKAQPDPPPPPPPPGAREIRVRVGGLGRARSRPPCALLLVLFRAGSLGRERLRLREILRDVRGRLLRVPRPPGPGVVGVLVLEGGEGEGEGARLQIDALLRQVFGRTGRPEERETLQAASYRPGAASEARAAACRALRAALKLREDGPEAKKQRIPSFLQCIPWARRRRQKEGHSDAAAGNISEDALQDPEEGVSLTNLEPNGNCEEACDVAAT